MEREDYVPFEVAMLLKEKGYDDYCNANYFTRDDNAFNYKEGEMCIGSHTIDGECITVPAPTLWEAQKLLREKHGIAICPIPYSSYWDYTIFDLKNFRDDDGNHKILGSRVAWASYEEALSEGIKEALKMI